MKHSTTAFQEPGMEPMKLHVPITDGNIRHNNKQHFHFTQWSKRTWVVDDDAAAHAAVTRSLHEILKVQKNKGWSGPWSV